MEKYLTLKAYIIVSKQNNNNEVIIVDITGV